MSFLTFQGKPGSVSRKRRCTYGRDDLRVVELVRNLVAHGDAREGK